MLHIGNGPKDISTKLKHWRGFQRRLGWKSAPVLELLRHTGIES